MRRPAHCFCCALEKLRCARLGHLNCAAAAGGGQQHQDACRLGNNVDCKWQLVAVRGDSCRYSLRSQMPGACTVVSVRLGGGQMQCPAHKGLC